MYSKLWIFLLGIFFHFTLLDLASGKTLVKPPRPIAPTPPKPSTRLLSNSSFPTPTCTAKNDFIGGPEETNFTTRNAMKSKNLRWTYFYVLPDPEFEQWERDVINNAMWNLWQIIPCIQFGIYPSDAKPTGDYMRLIKGIDNGCNSYVGRQGGKQNVNLQSPGCINLDTVMHELLHALGLQHEHCRHDRDDYLWIYEDNMIPEYKHAFDKVTTTDTTTYGIPYNYNSIMHYESWAFSKNNLSTMLAKNGQRVGTAGVLQDTDIKKLKAMYPCPA